MTWFFDRKIVEIAFLSSKCVVFICTGWRNGSSLKKSGCMIELGKFVHFLSGWPEDILRWSEIPRLLPILVCEGIWSALLAWEAGPNDSVPSTGGERPKRSKPT